jgi:hypothetical protein
LHGIARNLGWNYTRYADDLSFSFDAESVHDAMVGYLLARIRHIAQDEGFCVNEDKTRVLRRSASMKVTGIVVNERAGVSRREVRRLRAILHNASKTGMAAQNRDHDPQFEAKVRGKIEFVRMVNPDQAKPLLDAYGSIR